MSPTSYQAAPPRIKACHSSVPALGLSRRGPCPGCVAGERWLCCRASTGQALGEEPAFMRMRLAIFASLLLLGLVARAPLVRAAAEVHRMNIVFSAVPTEVRAGDFNDLISQLNDTQLRPNSLEPLDKISLAWLLDGELRYFARQNLAVSVGVSRIRAGAEQEYLPTIGASN